MQEPQKAFLRLFALLVNIVSKRTFVAPTVLVPRGGGAEIKEVVSYFTHVFLFFLPFYKLLMDLF